MDFTTVQSNLEKRGFTVSVFNTAAAAADYLDAQINQKTVGFGGSVTLDQMGLYERLSSHNTVHWHWRQTDRDARVQAGEAQIYLSSVNGLAETGEIINIDGTGNRVAEIFYGHEKVYLIVGENKLAPNHDAALHRARNIAAPRNAQRLGSNTPCAQAGDHCYDCQSPGRICRGLAVLWEAPIGSDIEVVLIHESLGY